MKKLLSVAIAIFGFAQIINAQEVDFGIKAGLNMSSLNGDDTEDFKTLTAFHVGLVAEITFSEKFSIQPELLYSAQGSKQEDTEQVDNEIELNYISLPIMAKFYIADGFNIEAGPQVSFLTMAKSDGGDIKDNTKGIDFGVNLGVGYKTKGGINFGVRYNLGLSNIVDLEEVESDEVFRNGVFQVSLTYLF